MGGTCSKKVVERVNNNPNDNIDKELTIPNGCAIYGSARSYLEPFIPDNGEYEWKREGTSSCNYCSNSMGDQTTCHYCDGWCCPIIGSSGIYTRKSYNANPLQCCLQGKDTIGNLTCDPKYRNPDGEGCNAILEDYCNSEDLFNNKACALYGATHVDTSNLLKKRYCNEFDKDKPEIMAFSRNCKKFCMENMGLCDEKVEAYCKLPQHVNDPMCACINTFIPTGNHLYNNPTCSDKKCMTQGYQTNSLMNSAKKCQQIHCDVYFQMDKNQRAYINDNNIHQRCGNSDNKDNDTVITTNWSKILLYTEISVFSIIFIIILYFIFIRLYHYRW